MKSSNSNRVGTPQRLDASVAEARRAIDRRSVLSLGGLAAGGAFAAGSGPARGLEAASSGIDGGDGPAGEPTAYQRTYYAKARF